MKCLFSDWDKVFFKIQNARHVFLFFDYDGTLTPIVSRPGLAKLSPKVKNSIKKLQKNPRFTLAIVSGRSLENIKKMVGIKNLIYAGNHGLEIEGRGIRFSKAITVIASRPIMKKIGILLHKELRHIKGVKVEDKGATLSVHYRMAAASDKSLVKDKFKRIVSPYVYAKKVRLSAGKEVLEVRPNLRWDKGEAVKWLLKGKKNTLPLYLGDDVTDTDVFRAIKGKGISIFIGSPKRSKGADYFLRNTKDVESFIERLLKSQQ